MQQFALHFVETRAVSEDDNDSRGLSRRRDFDLCREIVASPSLTTSGEEIGGTLTPRQLASSDALPAGSVWKYTTRKRGKPHVFLYVAADGHSIEYFVSLSRLGQLDY